MNKKLLFIFFLTFYFNIFSIHNFVNYVIENKKTVIIASSLWYIINFFKISLQKRSNKYQNNKDSLPSNYEPIGITQEDGEDEQMSQKSLSVFKSIGKKNNIFDTAIDSLYSLILFVPFFLIFSYNMCK